VIGSRATPRPTDPGGLIAAPRNCRWWGRTLPRELTLFGAAFPVLAGQVRDD
jgi:hypothetical protein